MSDLISRQAAIIALANNRCGNDEWDFAVTHDVETVKKLPSVTPQPEVIRCNDCKHWTNNIGDSRLRDNYCNEAAHGFHYRCGGDDYCSYAERMTNE